MQRPRMILVVAAACVVVGMSLSEPEAHASPRAKTYQGAITFPQPGGPVCFVFHSDGMFSFAIPGLQTNGAWFEIGGLWFSFSTFGSGGTNTLVIVMAGTTFEADAEALVAAALLSLIDNPIPPQPFLAAGHSVARCDLPPPPVTPKGSARRPGNSR